MSTRLAQGGRRIDRGTRLEFRFNGKRLSGFAGDTLASALLANDQMLVGRSFKYHRPRGILASGAEEPNALVNLGQGDRHEPDQRVTTTPLFDGLYATSQNHWPSLEFDIGAVNARLSPLLPAGFYYKTFIHPRPFWKHIFEPIVRQSAGLGKPTQDPDPDRYEHFHAVVDVLVVGGGVAGLTAARVAGAAGLRVLLVEQDSLWGGRAPVDGGEIADQAPAEWIADQVAALGAMDNVSMRLNCMGAGLYDHGWALAYERIADATPGDGRPRHRLWKIRAKQVVTATGAIERPLSFAGNDLPGVMLASAVRDYVADYGVSPGDRTVIATNNDDAYRTAIALVQAGLAVPAVIDARDRADGPLVDQARALGIRVETGRGIAGVCGSKRVTGVKLCLQAGEGAVLDEIGCDAVAMSGGWSPVVHLWSQMGGKLVWDDTQACFRPDPDRAPTGADGKPLVRVAGAANGAALLPDALKDAARQARMAAKAAGAAEVEAAFPRATGPAESPMQPVWMMPQGAGHKLRAKMWLDFQNDVKVTDIQLAAREGFKSVEHAKRYTTLGMATDQGKLSNINGLATLSKALGEDIPQVGTTTFRPPYTPISMGSIAGEARGEIFQPLRKTPIHDWHDSRGAVWEPVGHWRRPYCYPQGDETKADAVQREVLAVRNKVGMLDASTLGKLLVSGPDAAEFLNRVYTNMMGSLKVGRCRYGLMCNENGFLMDDGVVARLSEDSFLCHTTSGGAEAVHQHLEEWLQTEWWDLKVHVVNLTEQFGQIAVVGPQARSLLTDLGGMDLSADALPFMGWADGTLDGIDVRVFRISFSGELSFEIAAAANDARALWDKLLAAGDRYGVTPYGTEALHILRAEKGFIMIGDETDGTVTPQDLNLHWAISKKKPDYIGKRGQERTHLADADRWRLVGLQPVQADAVLPDGALALAPGVNANGQRNTQGRVTSTYFSPTLGHGIALALVKHGPDRMGEVLEFADGQGGTIPARIVDPVFYDKDGEKQNV